MPQAIALCATLAACAFTCASLRRDLQQWRAMRRNLERQLDRIKPVEVRWTITERKGGAPD